MNLNRIYGIDIIKLLACVGVVILHVTTLAFDIDQPMNWSSYMYYLGTFSIPLFFLINGFFLLNRKELPYSYIFKKMGGILFVVICWSVLYWLVSFNFHENIFRKIVGSLLQRGYFYQFWFFGSLLIMYPTLPFLKKILQNIKIHFVVMLLLLIIGSTVQLLNFFLPDVPIQKFVPQTLRLWTWYSYYILGGLIGRPEVVPFITKLQTPKINYLTATLVFLSPFIFFWICQNIFELKYAEYFYDSIFVKLLTVLIFISIYRIKLSSFSQKWVPFLSAGIMGIFIVHTHVIRLLSKILDLSFPLNNSIGILLVFSLSFLTVLTMSKLPGFKRLINI
ncbi:acyltransferase family protein [Streptococcus suis]|nr:acyltransferase family protein [Streptococcus suis]